MNLTLQTKMLYTEAIILPLIFNLQFNHQQPPCMLYKEEWTSCSKRRIRIVTIRFPKNQYVNLLRVLLKM